MAPTFAPAGNNGCVRCGRASQGGDACAHVPTNHASSKPTYQPLRCAHLPPPQLLNPSETFGDIIVDYCYVECSSACMTALVAFQAQHPQHRATEIKRSLRRGLDYVKRCAL